MPKKIPPHQKFNETKNFTKKILPKKIFQQKNLTNKIFCQPNILTKFFAEQKFSFIKSFTKKLFSKKICRKYFFCRKSYHWWKYKWHITLEAEIRHLGSTHKNKIIQGVFDLVGIGLTWNNLGWPQAGANLFYVNY